MLSFTIKPPFVRASRITPAIAAARARRAQRGEGEEECLGFSGWHDSSYELSQGLAVTEHDGNLADRATLELAVGLWLH